MSGPVENLSFSNIVRTPLLRAADFALNLTTLRKSGLCQKFAKVDFRTIFHHNSLLKLVESTKALARSQSLPDRRHIDSVVRRPSQAQQPSLLARSHLSRRYQVESEIVAFCGSMAALNLETWSEWRRVMSIDEENEKDYLNHHEFNRPLFDERSETSSIASSAARTVRSDSIKPAARSRRMGRAMRVVVVGGKKVGKTAILRQVACVEDITNQAYEPTIEDTYQVLLEEPDKAREILILHDTAGVSNYGPVELKKAYVQAADAFVLVYSSADYESFNRVDLLKKWIDRQFGKDKKEVPIVVLANMRDRPATVDSAFAHSWAAREKVKLFEVTAKDRQSLVDFIHYVGHRHFHPTKESKFSLSKKLKSEKSSNPAILMDF